MSTDGVTIRDAGDGDRAFLEEMLLAAINWDPARVPIEREAALAMPEIAHYLDGWRRRDDAGVVAEDAASIEPIGAAWWRHFAWDDPGYGFVDPAVPEVSIGVVATRRGRGVGRALLVALHRAASRRGIERLSLSVEKANPARRLYQSLGYTDVVDAGGSVTMLLRLQPS